MMRCLLLGLALICGCSKSDKEYTVFPIDEAPSGMLEIAQKELPDVTFDTARKLKNGNVELRGKNKKGKVREVEFDSTGNVVEIE
jgi:hypothetical protein